jgi:acetylornithine/succinyldiaminopimelate/putrescine aminotransferase
MIKTNNRRIKKDYSVQRTDFDSERYLYETKAVYPQSQVFWNKAKGHSIWDKEGNKWIDMTSGIFVANAGHANPKIKKAIKKQLDKNMLFAYTYDTDIRTSCAKKLLDVSPPCLEKLIFMNSGTEATDVAYRLIKTWGKQNKRKYIVCFRGSYHGRALSCDLMCGDENSSVWSSIADEDIIFVDFPYGGDDEFDPSVLGDPSNIAAFMIETYQGWGACMYPTKYLEDLYKFARQCGALVCFDEVQSGFYRMGSLYGFETYSTILEPDLVCVGKGITSSLPLSAVLGRREIIDINKDANVSSTHSGNALSCAAATANIDYLTSENFQKKLKKKVDLFEKTCNEYIQHNIVEKIYCRGMVCGIILETTQQAEKVVDICIENGVLPVRTSRESIKLGPPLSISMTALKEALNVVNQAILSVGNND